MAVALLVGRWGRLHTVRSESSGVAFVLSLMALAHVGPLAAAPEFPDRLPAVGATYPSIYPSMSGPAAPRR